MNRSPAPRSAPAAARPRGWLVALALAQSLSLAACASGVGPEAQAAESSRAEAADPPGRVGRLAVADGPVSLLDADGGGWEAAEANRPLTTGDRIATGARARAELRIGSTVLRLGERSELELRRLDDDALRVQLHRGSLALTLASGEFVSGTEVATAEVRLVPEGPGLYRIDRRLDGADDRSLVMALRGSLRVDGGGTVAAPERRAFWRDGSQLASAPVAAEADEFGDWVARQDRDDERAAVLRADRERQTGTVVPRELTGAEDLERFGSWANHPEHGWIWLPAQVAAGWTPYRDGRWVWMRPWGWTWVDAAPWGFATSHYGRWVHWQGRWGWWPGVYAVRPVFAPALVAFVGTPGLSVSISIGSPPRAWVPLAPRDWYVPWQPVSPRYVDRMNPWRPGWGPRPPRPQGPWQAPGYGGHRQVPGAVTVWNGERHGRPGRPGGQVLREAAERLNPPIATPRPERGGRGDERRDDRRDDRRADRPFNNARPLPERIGPQPAPRTETPAGPRAERPAGPPPQRAQPPQNTAPAAPPSPQPQQPPRGNDEGRKRAPAERVERVERAERAERPERQERSERQERPGRPERRQDAQR